MNQDLYVMIPDEATVQETKEKLTVISNEVEMGDIQENTNHAA